MPEKNPHTPLDDELLSAFLDDELTPEERARVEERLAEDPAARQMLDQLRAVSQAVRDLPHESVGEDLREAILQRARSANRASADTEPEQRVPAAAGRPRWTIGRSSRGWMWAGLAVAAALLIMIYQPGPPNEAGLPDAVALRSERALGEHEEHGESRVASEPRGPSEEGTASSVESRAAAGSAEGGRELASAPPSAAPTFGAPLARSDAPASSDESGRRADATDSLARSSAAAGRGAGDDAEAESIAAPPPTGFDEEQLLVVHVHVTPVAFRSKAFDGLLARNGIELEEPPAADDRALPAAEAPAEQDRLSLQEQLSTEVPQGQLDAVLVDAPASQVESCLVELDADNENYLAVAVEDQSATSHAFTDKEALPTTWQKYNRGNVPQRQLVQLAPAGVGGKEKAGEYSFDARSRYQLGTQSELSATRRKASNEAQLGRAVRVQVAQQEYDRDSMSGKLSEPTVSHSNLSRSESVGLKLQARGAEAQPADQSDDTVQVLFVLVADAEPRPSPPADEGLKMDER